MLQRIQSLGFSMATLTLAACSSPDSAAQDGADCEGAKCDAVDDTTDPDARVCFGVRGNGQLIFAHFGSLARIYENTGRMFWGASGGSSGSITTFLVDSIQTNKVLPDCDGSACSEAEAANRAALLLKSLQGYVEVLGETDEAVALLQLGPLAQSIQTEGLSALALEDAEAARESLLTLLGSDDLADIINDELVDTITNSPDPAFHVQDVAQALSKIAAFDATDDTIFVRPGIIDFDKLAEKLGRIANFYAGYGPYDAAGMIRFFDQCATPGTGMAWDELSGLAIEDGGTCGELFKGLVTEYRTALLADEDAFPKRIDDIVGSEMHALISTSVLENDAVDQWERAFADYKNADAHTLEVDFDDVGFGYFGSEADLAATEANYEGYDDLKTDKFRALGPVTWRTALTYSPAEPGLTRAQEIDDSRVSAGGWSDLHPTLVLNNLGCDEVIYVTRRGATSDFVTHDRADPEATPRGVATLLNMSDEDWRLLYDLLSPSAYDLSVREADSVWCTDWNQSSPADISGTIDDAYNALQVTDSEFWSRSYDNNGDGAGIAGCGPL